MSLVFLMLGVLIARSQGFTFSNATPVMGGLEIKKMDGNYVFATGGVYYLGSLLVNSPPFCVGGAVINDKILAITSDGGAHIFLNNVWEEIPNIVGAKQVIASTSNGFRVYTASGKVYYGPTMSFSPPSSSAFVEIAEDSINEAIFPFQGVQDLGNDKSLSFYGGACREIVVGDFGGSPSMTSITTGQYHDAIDAVDRGFRVGTANYVATTRPFGTSNMANRLIAIDRFGNQEMIIQLNHGVKIATVDTSRVVFAAGTHVTITIPGMTTIADEGMDVSIFNKSTNALENVFDIDNAGVGDVEINQDTLRVAINPNVDGAWIVLQSGTILGPFYEPTILSLTPSTTTSVDVEREQNAFSIAYNGTNPVAKATKRGVITISNLVGQKLKSFEINEGDTPLELQKGTYLATFHGEDGTVATQKVVKN